MSAPDVVAEVFRMLVERLGVVEDAVERLGQQSVWNARRAVGSVCMIPFAGLEREVVWRHQSEQDAMMRPAFKDALVAFPREQWCFERTQPTLAAAQEALVKCTDGRAKLGAINFALGRLVVHFEGDMHVDEWVRALVAWMHRLSGKRAQSAGPIELWPMPTTAILVVQHMVQVQDGDVLGYIGAYIESLPGPRCRSFVLDFLQEIDLPLYDEADLLRLRRQLCWHQ